MDDLAHLKAHLKGKVVILGIGNTLLSDDGFGSLLAQRLSKDSRFIVYDSSSSPENYLGKIIKDKPDNIVMVDAVDFGGKPGEFRVLEGENLETTNIFSTHNASLSLAINYLKKHIPADIIALAVQPKTLAFSEKLSPEVAETLEMLKGWFDDAKKEG